MASQQHIDSDKLTKCNKERKLSMFAVAQWYFIKQLLSPSSEVAHNICSSDLTSIVNCTPTAHYLTQSVPHDYLQTKKPAY